MKDLTEGKEGVQILTFAAPMLLGNIFQQLYNVIDSIIVGNYLGKEALSAVGASFPIIFVLISLIIGVASGTTIIIAQYFGAKKYDKLKTAIDTMYVVLFFASFFVAAIGIFFNDEIFNLIKLPENVIPEAKKYLSIILGGVITMFGFNGTSAVLRGLGDSKTPLYFLIISTIMNILFDFLFVLGFGMGVEGVAIATVLAQAGAFLTAVFYLNKYHKIINISFFNVDFDWDIFKKSMRIGLPSGLQHMFVALGMMALYRIVNRFGTETIAAYSVVGRLNSFAMMPAMNFSAALATFAGQNLGANKPKRVASGLKFTFFFTTAISIFFTIIALSFTRQLVEIFTPDPEVIRIGMGYLLIVPIFYVSFSAMFTINGVFRGAGDTIIPMFITLFSLWLIRIPISWFLSERIGIEGVWWGIPIAWIMGLIVSFFYYLSGHWKNKVIVKYND